MKDLSEVPFEDIKIGQVVRSQYVGCMGFVCGLSVLPLDRFESFTVCWGRKPPSTDNVSHLFHNHGDRIDFIEGSILSPEEYNNQRDLVDILEKYRPKECR